MQFHTHRHWHIAAWLLAVTAFLSACGTTQHVAKLEAGYVPPSEAMVRLGKVDVPDEQTYDADVKAILTEALTESLKEHGLLASDSDADALTLRAEVVDYQQGSAFKRWLLPGYGSTVLEVHCDLLESNEVVGVADARRTVDAGGGYTVGAWKSIFNDVADDIVGDISTQLGRQ